MVNHPCVPTGDKELLFFYKDVILYYENVVKNESKGYDSRKKRFVEYLKENDIHFIYSRAKTIDIPSTHQNNPKSFIIFKQTKGYSRFASYLCHVRNSFAHGLFSKERDGNVVYLRMHDINNKGNLSMVTYIPIKQFAEIIMLIKQSKIKTV